MKDSRPPARWQHPLRREDVLALIETWTLRSLAESGGTGRVVIEIDFHAWEAMQVTPLTRGARVPLTPRARKA